MKISTFGGHTTSLTLKLPHKNPEKERATLNKTYEVFLDGIFLIHRKYHLFIKAPYENFYSPTFFEHKFSNHRKENYDYTVKELGYPRFRLTALNDNSSFTSRYVFLKYCVSDKKVLEQPWTYFTPMKLCKIVLWSNPTPDPQNNINYQENKNHTNHTCFELTKALQPNHHRINHLPTLYTH